MVMISFWIGACFGAAAMFCILCLQFVWEGTFRVVVILPWKRPRRKRCL